MSIASMSPSVALACVPDRPRRRGRPRRTYPGGRRLSAETYARRNGPRRTRHAAARSPPSAGVFGDGSLDAGHDGGILQLAADGIADVEGIDDAATVRGDLREVHVELEIGE